MFTKKRYNYLFETNQDSSSFTCYISPLAEKMPHDWQPSQSSNGENDESLRKMELPFDYDQLQEKCNKILASESNGANGANGSYIIGDVFALLFLDLIKLMTKLASLHEKLQRKFSPYKIRFDMNKSKLGLQLFFLDQQTNCELFLRSHEFGLRRQTFARYFRKL